MSRADAFKTQAFYDSNYHSHVNQKPMEDEVYFQGQAVLRRELYFRDIEGKRVLEFGCGLGQNIALIPGAAGFDASREAREHCQKRGLKVFAKATQVPKGKWDIVLCRHVLEHLEDPLSALRLMRNFLSPGGQLYLVLPRDKDEPSGLEPDIHQHLFTWNFRAANNLLNRAGYKVVRNEYRYFQGVRLFLPLKKFLGDKVYVTAVQALGRSMGQGEFFLVAEAK